MQTQGTQVEESLPALMGLVRCLSCHGELQLVGLDESAERPELGTDGWFACRGCERRYRMSRGTLRMLPSGDSDGTDVKQRTAESFAYEWEQFGEELPRLPQAPFIVRSGRQAGP
jgi:uncharacterized protein YbaR (Trm112 family)